MSDQYGYPPPGQTAYRPAPPNDSGAVWALVMGILSFVVCGIFLSIPAIVVGRTSIKRIDGSGGALGGRGMAMAGFVLGIVNVVIFVLALVLVIGVFAFGSVIRDAYDETSSNVNSAPAPVAVTGSGRL